MLQFSSRESWPARRQIVPLLRFQQLHLGSSVKARLRLDTVQEDNGFFPSPGILDPPRRVIQRLDHNNQNTVWHAGQGDIDEFFRVALYLFFGIFKRPVVHCCRAEFCGLV